MVEKVESQKPRSVWVRKIIYHNSEILNPHPSNLHGIKHNHRYMDHSARSLYADRGKPLF